MPELPEVETVRRGLEQVLPGRTARRLEVRGKRSVRRQSPEELTARLVGRRFGRPGRHGKFLALPLDDGQALVVHLRMSGQLLHVTEPDRVPPRPHTHVILGLDDDTELRFVDPRTFGEWFVTGDLGEDGNPSFFDDLGPDPLLDGLSPRLLQERFSNRHLAVKSALTDQRIVAGVGSIYADEICHAARVRPDRRLDTLGPDEVRRLAEKTRTVLRAAVAARGSSLRDSQYRDLMGDPGGYQARHRVYDRRGQPCRRCGSPISRISFGARTAFCCEACQR